MNSQAAGSGSGRFAVLYALANVGVFVCFIPLIGLFLPQRAMAIAPESGVRLLSWILLVGAMGSSAANLGAGWLSDRLLVRHGSRLPMVGCGLMMTLASFAGLAAAESSASLLVAFLLFQICFNMLFAPFNALATDHVDDAMKGRIFGLLSLGLPLSQLAVVGIVASGIEIIGSRIAIVATFATLMILPMLVAGRKAAGPPIPTASALQDAAAVVAPARTLRRDFALAWSGRLLIQCAAVAAGSYLLVHLSDFDRAGNDAEPWFGALSLMALIIGLVVGVAIGRWSDATARRRPFLWATALLVSMGSAMLGMGTNWPVIAAGYAVFSVGLTGFLTIDGAAIAQLIGQSGNRGSRLGVMNLTNTLPALLVPLVALALDQGVAGVTEILFILVAAGALFAASLVSMIRMIP